MRVFNLLNVSFIVIIQIKLYPPMFAPTKAHLFSPKHGSFYTPRRDKVANLFFITIG